MHRRLTIPLTLEDKAACVKWSCGMLTVLAMIVTATLTLPVFRTNLANVSRVHARNHAAVRSELPSGSVDHLTGDLAAKR